MNGKRLTGYSKTGTSVTYAYNEDGLRTRKTFNGTTTDYYYNGSVLIGMQSGNTVQRFSYDAQGKVVAVDYSTNGGSSYTTYYYLRNAQGDIVKLIDGNRNTVVEYTYDSWGKILATTGSLATSLGRNQPFRYRGYVYDTETGWYYLQSRYYEPTTCRFISSDAYLSTGQGVLGHNSYAYCLNNSVNAEDPTGYFSWFSSGKGRRDDEDAGWYGGSSGYGGFVRRISYNNGKGYSSGYSSSHSNRCTSETKAPSANSFDVKGFSTGRCEPNNLYEQIAMKQVQLNPRMGRIIIRNLNDPRLPAGTEKYHQTVKSVPVHDGKYTIYYKATIHYLHHKDYGFFDFKFKESGYKVEEK